MRDGAAAGYECEVSNIISSFFAIVKKIKCRDPKSESFSVILNTRVSRKLRAAKMYLCHKKSRGRCFNLRIGNLMLEKN